MTQIVVLPSVLGVRQGVLDAADRLRAAGHHVLVADFLAGRTFDEYEPALAHAEGELGHGVLMQRAMDAVAEAPDGFALLGFSLGTVMTAHVASLRPVSGVVMVAGAIPPSAFGDGRTWPAGVPGQTHSTIGDPWREQELVEATAAEAAGAGAFFDVFDYPGAGHLFTDASLPDEYDAEATELMWSRVLPFVAGLS